MYTGTEETLKNDLLRETVHLRHHDSGLPVYYCPKPGFRKRYACFATRFGSIDSSFRRAGGDRLDVPDGVAHFLEHQMFEGPEENAFHEFARLGASSNAYTGFGVTNYLFSCSDSFYENLSHLIHFVQEPHFVPDRVEKEKGIIGQEIRMYEDSPGWRGFFGLLESLYHAHPVRKSITGTVESISGIDDQVLIDCYRTFYHPENMILFAIGDLEGDALYQAVDRALEGKSYEPLGEIERFYPEEPSTVVSKLFELDMEVSMPRLLLGFKDADVGYGGDRYLRKELITDILLEILFGRASAFYQRLYEETLIDGSFSASYTGMPGAGHSLVGGETTDPERLAREVTEEVVRARRDGIAEADFERQRRAVVGSFLRQFNSLEFIANNFCSYRFFGCDLFEIVRILYELSPADLSARLDEHLDPERVSLSIIRPKERA